MTEPTQSNVVWLTQAKYDELKAELEELRGPTRSALVKRVSDARDEGDLKENAGYHAARDELGKLDGRVQQLVDMLERAEVGETPADDGVVEPGMKVTVLARVASSTRRSCSAPARWPAAAPTSTSSPRSPRWARRSTAPAGRDGRPTTRPTARDQRPRSSRPCPYVGLTSLDDTW